ncbi:peptidoglycan DD-metalloendopeptidase family protein [Vibrio sp. SS-MA-C1-2]|uniref:peptidoglycan DD-metalloendopeptidase family protein n=1 Tax=Vibrio sp. SS-MA-C1-2 TaxID=2908646 RepID=UPI001F3C6C91|nr:peptidoglycan DD-metalloendopeptidase family protein [Vibrio sp. SS-MA-C1-2]UJF19650.1 peptidoglycan DD-metalloendopeptidase family protein [Vibrio sp. SS-MA-C1-2]
MHLLNSLLSMSSQKYKKALPHFHRKLIAIIGLLLIVILIFPTMDIEKPETKWIIGKAYSLPISPLTEKITEVEQPSEILSWKTITIKSGDSLALLFEQQGLSANTLYRLVNADKKNKALTRIKPGDTFKLGLNSDNQLMTLIKPLSKTSELVMMKHGDSYQTETVNSEVETRDNFAQATISSSFWAAAENIGLTPNQIMELAGMFGWDIDFALDIRKNDHFSVLYEERYADGKYIGPGHILAAQFTNQGETFTTIRDKTGKYYTPEGKAMRKTFLRSPVNFRYVSSGFNPRRLHPVTGKVRSHRGTDYVAPRGTPIWAAGDGVVMKAGYNRFNGNYVFIKHSSTYITKYLHLTKRMVKTGQRVKQGQTIGTLGSTGRVTGAHLHYEFLVNGVHRNPRTVKLPQAASLKGEKKKEFQLLAAKQQAQFEQYKSISTNLVLSRLIVSEEG